MSRGLWLRFRRSVAAYGAIWSLVLSAFVAAPALVAPMPASAQSLTGNCWYTELFGGGSACYSTPDAACSAQWQSYNPDATYLSPTQASRYFWACNWVGPGIGSAYVEWQCQTGIPPYGGVCLGPGDGNFDANCTCNGGTGNVVITTTNPIDVLSGNKHFEAVDFADSAGSLILRRVYSSQANAGASSQVSRLANAMGLATWRYDFQYEIQLAPTWSSTYTQFNLVLPAGQSLGFTLNAGGSTTSVPVGQFAMPQTDYTLVLLGTPNGSGGYSVPSDLSTLLTTTSQWTLTGPDDTQYTIQTQLDPATSHYDIGRPVSFTRRSGNTFTLAYGTQNQLTSISDGFSTAITFEWLGVSTETSPDVCAGTGPLPLAICRAHLPGGYAVNYTYSSLSSGPDLQADQLLKVQYVDASGVVQDSTSYVYGDPAFATFITAISDASGIQRWSVTYDSVGHATSSSGPSGVDNFTVAYGAFPPPSGTSTFTRTVTNPLSKAFTYTYTLASTGVPAGLTSVTTTASAYLPATTRTYTYCTDSPSCYPATSVCNQVPLPSPPPVCPVGLVAGITDENGNLQTMLHDPRGMAATDTEASGSAVARTTTTSWDAARRVPTTVAAPTVSVGYVYY